MKMRDLINLVETDEKKVCPACRGHGDRAIGWKGKRVTCRACDGTGNYPDPERIASKLDDREIAAVLSHRDGDNAISHRDGMLKTRLAALGITNGVARSGDNAELLTDLGVEVRTLLRARHQG